nr:Ig-like domain-containing protein [Eubacterium sp.]
MVFALIFGLSDNGDPSMQAAAKPKLSKKKLTIIVGKTAKIKVKNSKAKVKWSSNKKKVATVTGKGIVKAKKAGKATITARVGKKKLKCKVTVKEEENKTPVITPTVPPMDVSCPAPTQAASITPAPTASAVPTQIPTTTPVSVVKNEEDVAELQNIIVTQKELGATISEDLDNTQEYTWNEEGRLTEITWDGKNLSGSLAFSDFPYLSRVTCANNPSLTSLDMSNCDKLWMLLCHDNSLTSLNVSGCSKLQYFYCSANQFTTLDVSECPLLVDLMVDYDVNVIGDSNGANNNSPV